MDRPPARMPFCFSSGRETGNLFGVAYTVAGQWSLILQTLRNKPGHNRKNLHNMDKNFGPNACRHNVP